MPSEKGLFTKYILWKRIPCDCGADQHCKKCNGVGFTMERVSDDAAYFVLRVDRDDWHGEACRLALAAYATMAEKHNLSLAIDIWEWLPKHAGGLELAYRNAGKTAADYFRKRRDSEFGQMLQGKDVKQGG